jgi:hypothetical protein
MVVPLLSRVPVRALIATARAERPRREAQTAVAEEELRRAQTSFPVGGRLATWLMPVALAAPRTQLAQTEQPLMMRVKTQLQTWPCGQRVV